VAWDDSFLMSDSDGAKNGDDAEVGNSSKGDRNEGVNRVHFEMSRVIKEFISRHPTDHGQAEPL
jgi:hypothetical protein